MTPSRTPGRLSEGTQKNRPVSAHYLSKTVGNCSCVSLVSSSLDNYDLDRN